MIAVNEINRLENAIRQVNRELSEKKSFKDWKRLTEEELFSELCSCIIGSRITFEKAQYVSRILRQEGLLSLDCLLENPKRYKTYISATLKRERCLYHRSKADYIVRTGTQIYWTYQTTIKKILKNNPLANDAREELSKICVGIGLKQASLFLRNIHYADELAILDTHVINYMHLIGLNENVDKGLTKKLYLTYEEKLKEYSQKFNTSIAQLDVAIWVVMRIVSREFKWMLSF